MFKPVFLKQFRQFHFFKTLGYLYMALKIREIEYVCEKGSIERRERAWWQNLYGGTKNFLQRMWKAYTGFSVQHKTFSALNYAQDFGTTVEQSLKRTTSSKWATHEKSNCPVSCHAFVSTLNYVSPIGENDDWIYQLNSKNNGPALLFEPKFWHWLCFVVVCYNGLQGLKMHWNVDQHQDTGHTATR